MRKTAFAVAVASLISSSEPAAAALIQVTNLPTGKFISIPSITGDGRLVVLGSNGNLGGLNPTPIGNVFVYDVLTNQFTRITAEGGYDPVISADARYVAFASSADYTSRNEDGSDELFRYDRTRKRFQ